ncbi:recombinase family protein [Enterobacter mori]|uniref:Recombinase family protein n=1 Tax=Enterobacter mori TaxID=539813 RepID=A0A7T0DU33_9ENTR|nr:recombinase family protein [Enterobacter mori]QPJ99393.1 recombinase family protein [Enterobacter mori]
MRSAKAYSYVRFSTPKQAQGDSYRRQLQQARDYCTTHNLVLDDKTIEDFGVSAFRGSNRTDGALGRFIDAVKSGEIEKGSYLLVESVDRLSRQAIEEALTQFLEIVREGIVIVTLSDNQVFRSGEVDFTKLIVSIVYMARANDESEMKSRRSRAAWSNGRQQARENNKVIANSRLPSWLTLEGDKIVPIPERVAIVNEMFQMARSGQGYQQIAKIFRDKDYKTFGQGKAWRPAGIQSVVKSRAVIGEFQPHIIYEGKRVPDGDPLFGYYPTVVSPAIFAEVQHIVDKRNNHSGSYRKGLYNNLFSGVIRCQCGELLRFHNKGSKGQVRNYLVCPMEGVTGCELPYLPYNRIEPQLLQALSRLSRVMKQRQPQTGRASELKDDLAVLRNELEAAGKKRVKAAQLVLDFDDDADFRMLFEESKNACHVLEEKIVQIEGEIMALELSTRTIDRFLHPEDLNSTEQRQQFNSQLKSAITIEFIYENVGLVAVIKDLEGELMLEQAFGPKLMSSIVHDYEGHICVKTIADAPYVDPVWVEKERADYEKGILVEFDECGDFNIDNLNKNS